MIKSYTRRKDDNGRGFYEPFSGKYLAQRRIFSWGSLWRWRIQSSQTINKTFSFTTWEPNSYFDKLIEDTDTPAKWVEVKI